MPMNLCNLEFQYFSYYSEGDAVPRLKCWACVPLIGKTF